MNFGKKVKKLIILGGCLITGLFVYMAWKLAMNVKTSKKMSKKISDPARFEHRTADSKLGMLALDQVFIKTF